MSLQSPYQTMANKKKTQHACGRWMVTNAGDEQGKHCRVLLLYKKINLTTISVKKSTPGEAANRYAVYLTVIVIHQQSPEAEIWMLPPTTGDSELSLSYFFFALSSKACFAGTLSGSRRGHTLWWVYFK